ncbi:MAG: hypothetical protein WCO78_03220 [Candidatus Roizmanbacteria bacterium]
MKKDILIMFGGISAEHEVSIITGLQVFEKIDRTRYTPHAIYISKNGQMLYLPALTSRKNFMACRRLAITGHHDAKDPLIQTTGLIKKSISPSAAYMAFHGGSGESGPVQGFLETIGVPYTGPSQESAVITMNKQLTKSALATEHVLTVPGKSYFSKTIQRDSHALTQNIMANFTLPLIVKPVHLGSSIGIKVVHTEIELEKALVESSYMDSEILVEMYLTDFKEYNCAVRSIGGTLEASEIERPLSSKEILSFADKYERGGKKTGASGMASLERELPAKISPELKLNIQETAKKAFTACRCTSMVRIDFMYTAKGELYLTEINPIPGSMAFYLWEASGISFQEQITDLLEQAVKDHAAKTSLNLEYKSDIVDKFITQ